MFDLTGKVALVTGASRGIGRAIAGRLAEQGAIIVAAARGDHAHEVAAQLNGGGRRAEAIALDVTDDLAVQRLPADIVERFGRLDIVISNAGITRDQLVMRMKRADWDDVIATNLTAAFTSPATRSCRWFRCRRSIRTIRKTRACAHGKTSSSCGTSSEKTVA